MISKESIDHIEVIKRDGEVIKISCSDISEAFQLGIDHMSDSLLCENKLEESFYGIMERVKKKDESKGSNRPHNQTKDPESRMVTLIARGFSILLHLKVI